MTPLWLTENYFSGLEDDKKTGGRADGPPLRHGWRMEVGLGSVSKKRSSSCRSLKKSRRTDVSFPEKGRQLFVAANMAPLGISWVRHCTVVLANMAKANRRYIFPMGDLQL
jgi:hypothetical protein